MSKITNVDDPFYARLHQAEEAGLSREYALKVAYLEMTLDEALGDCNYEQECGAIFADPTTIVNDCGCDFDPNCPRCFPF